MTRVLVLGAGGFVGSACVRALEHRGAVVSTMRSPRVRTPARRVEEIGREVTVHGDTVAALADATREQDVVLNCAGVADATGQSSDVLYGANALLPPLVGEACRLTSVPRFIHVSSAAVQGRMNPLRETAEISPFSPYSASKALGEQALAVQDPLGLIIFRPTSVHGPDREVTRSLARLARSRLSCIAGTGDRLTPQVLIENVSAAVAFLVDYERHVPRIVLQPSEEVTTAGLMKMLGSHPPLSIPAPFARVLITVGFQLANAARRGQGAIRRLELLWLGQDQEESWLSRAGFRIPAGEELWKQLARELDTHGS